VFAAYRTYSGITIHDYAGFRALIDRSR